MAQKRMFSLSVVDTDLFIEMPLSSRLLYYELGMRADDDGFVANWKKILLFTGLKEDDLKVLLAKNFVIPFESGVIVIRHWRLNNYLQKDRTKPTIYQKELSQLSVDDNNVYTLYTDCIHSIDKNSIDKISIVNNIYSAENDTKNRTVDTTVNTKKNNKVEILKQKEKWFEEFWNSYPRKDNRKKAEEKFNKICSNQKTFEKIMNSLEFQKQNVFSKEKKYIPHAITWLNQERYNDEFDLLSQQPKELTPLDEEYYQNDLDF